MGITKLADLIRQDAHGAISHKDISDYTGNSCSLSASLRVCACVCTSISSKDELAANVSTQSRDRSELGVSKLLHPKALARHKAHYNLI